MWFTASEIIRRIFDTWSGDCYEKRKASARLYCAKRFQERHHHRHKRWWRLCSTRCIGRCLSGCIVASACGHDENHRDCQFPEVVFLSAKNELFGVFKIMYCNNGLNVQKCIEWQRLKFSNHFHKHSPCMCGATRQYI